MGSGPPVSPDRPVCLHACPQTRKSPWHCCTSTSDLVCTGSQRPSVTMSLLLSLIVPVLLAGSLPLLLSLPWAWSAVRYCAEAECMSHNPAPTPLAATDLEPSPAYQRTTVNFSSHGERLEAWLYTPSVAAASEGEPARPEPGKCLIMAHGLGGQKDFGLEKFAKVFAGEGFTVLVFDYRCFGGSSGEPRNWISPGRHVEDWVAAIRSLQPGGEIAALGVSCASLALWGTSFSGGHVLVAAAKVAADVHIDALISQVPHLSGFEASKASLLQRGPLRALLMLVAGLHDVVRSKLGLSAAYIRIVGKPGDLAFMLLNEEEEQAYYAKHPAVKLGGWTPWAPARLALEISRYSPVKYLDKVNCPVLLISATKDALCAPHVIRAAAGRCSKCELLELDVNHFAIYVGQAFDDSTREMVNFLNRHMK